MKTATLAISALLLSITPALGKETLRSMPLPQSQKELPTYGYVPPSFPRDPIAINQFDEHIAIGQILEPLVETDEAGRLTAGVAESWQILNEGREYRFKLRSGLKFSNGAPITAQDAAYSIQRHLKTKSQSASFLDAIDQVETNGELELTIKTKRKEPSLIKALSRDQLGILPKDWKFEPESNEPFVASGAYRLVKDRDRWTLSKNNHYRASKDVRIESWEILFFKSTTLDIPENRVADYVPAVNQAILNQIKTTAAAKKTEIKIEERLSYNQTSLWFHPKGQAFSDTERRNQISQIILIAVQDYAQKAGLQSATGAIPVGVLGYLSNAPKPKNIITQEVPKSSTKLHVIKIASVSLGFKPFFESDNTAKILAKHQETIEVRYFTPLEFDQISLYKPDLVTGSWAGGFNDPVGFLGILPGILGMPLLEYLNPHQKIFEEARAEGDWEKRAQLFRQFGEMLIREQFMIPGWRIPSFRTLEKSITVDHSPDRYTPKIRGAFYQGSR
jgi:ABC-type transport system substrate-binding protein